MSPTNTKADRRIATRVFIALLASVGVYALLPALLPASARHFSKPPRDSALWGLLATGAGEYLAATILGRRLLSAKAGAPGARVRSYFLVRFAAAEAIGIFGIAAFLLGASMARADVFFAVSAAAFFSSYPGRDAFVRLLRIAGEPSSTDQTAETAD